MSILVDRLARIVLLLAPLGLLVGCQGAGSSYPLFSIPGVTRVSPPGSWEHNGDAQYYPDLTPATSGPVENKRSERPQGAASLSWVPHQGQPASGSAVVPANFEEPVGTGVHISPLPPRLLQPPTGARPLLPAADAAGLWTSRHDPR
ncbi:MAG: hypothetical protein VB855_03500 [Pirellulaceae bacterium]